MTLQLGVTKSTLIIWFSNVRKILTPTTMHTLLVWASWRQKDKLKCKDECKAQQKKVRMGQLMFISEVLKWSFLSTKDLNLKILPLYNLIPYLSQATSQLLSRLLTTSIIYFCKMISIQMVTLSGFTSRWSLDLRRKHQWNLISSTCINQNRSTNMGWEY